MYYTMFQNRDGDAFIQFQDACGNWLTIGQCPNQGPLVIHEMRQAQSLYPDKRIRAADSGGRLIDKL